MLAITSNLHIWPYFPSYQPLPRRPIYTSLLEIIAEDEAIFCIARAGPTLAGFARSAFFLPGAVSEWYALLTHSQVQPAHIWFTRTSVHAVNSWRNSPARSFPPRSYDTAPFVIPVQRLIGCK